MHAVVRVKAEDNLPESVLSFHRKVASVISLAASSHFACSDELSWDQPPSVCCPCSAGSGPSVALHGAGMERALGFSLAIVHSEMKLLLVSIDPGASHMVIIA